jgi:2-methylcitrate dehydratase PrpD
MTNLTESIARLICNFQPNTVPEEAFYRSKIGVLDGIGVALAGSREAVGKIMLDYADALTCAKEATIWGTSRKVSDQEAALVNGTLCHALDYDDMNRSVLGHPSAVLVPALFAVTEKLRLPGRKLLEGYVVGLEAAARLGRIFGVQAYEKSWHPTSVLGVIGACAGSSYLLGLNFEQTLNAIGIAASEASGIKKNFGSMTKPLHAGSAARKGIWAAALATRGFGANAQALDGRFGFFNMFNDAPLQWKEEMAADRPLDIMSAGLVFKQYPCCGGLHSLLDIVFALKEKHTLNADLIREIECRVNPRRVSYLDRPQVSEPAEAKFSIHYCVAVAIAQKTVGFDDFTPAALKRPQILALMKKVRLISDDALAEFASEVIIRNGDGSQFAGKLEKAKGAPDFPLSEAELLHKFNDCAKLVLPAVQAEKAGAALMQIEKEKTLDRIAELLSASA